MESCGFVFFSLPKQLGSQLAPVVFQRNSSLVDKLEQAYFSKGFM